MVACFLLSLPMGPVISVRLGTSPAWGLAGLPLPLAAPARPRAT
jgi:hypothetical protein